MESATPGRSASIVPVPDSDRDSTVAGCARAGHAQGEQALLRSGRDDAFISSHPGRQERGGPVPQRRRSTATGYSTIRSQRRIAPGPRRSWVDVAFLEQPMPCPCWRCGWSRVASKPSTQRHRPGGAGLPGVAHWHGRVISALRDKDAVNMSGPRIVVGRSGRDGAVLTALRFDRHALARIALGALRTSLLPTGTRLIGVSVRGRFSASGTPRIGGELSEPRLAMHEDHGAVDFILRRRIAACCGVPNEQTDLDRIGPTSERAAAVLLLSTR